MEQNQLGYLPGISGACLSNVALLAVTSTSPGFIPSIA